MFSMFLFFPAKLAFRIFCFPSFSGSKIDCLFFVLFLEEYLLLNFFFCEVSIKASKLLGFFFS